MSFNRARFLIEVLGPDGARALAKAASRSEYLAQMVVPRTILAWLEATPNFDASIPGLPDGYLSFQKAEDGFTGTIALSKSDDVQSYVFKSASIFHVAGAVATMMELDSLMFGNARNGELQRFGKSIDLMAKSHLVAKELEKRAEESAGDATGEYSRQEIYQKDEKPASGKCSECGGTKGKHYDRLVAGLVLKCKNDPSKKPLEKKALGEGTGSAAGPVAPAAPIAPTATAQPPSTPQKLPKKDPSAKAPKPAAAVKLTRSETLRNCPACSKNQFHDGKFVGCVCFSALAKSVKANWHADQSVDLTFGDEWDRETFVTLLESFGRK